MTAISDLPDPSKMRVDVATLPEGWVVLILGFGGEMPIPESLATSLEGVKTERIGPRRYREMSVTERRRLGLTNLAG